MMHLLIYPWNNVIYFYFIDNSCFLAIFGCFLLAWMYLMMDQLFKPFAFNEIFNYFELWHSNYDSKTSKFIGPFNSSLYLWNTLLARGPKHWLSLEHLLSVMLNPNTLFSICMPCISIIRDSLSMLFSL